MPGYTRPWPDVLNLLGSRDADEIDDASRETKVDLTQRFSDILEDVNADPWALKGSLLSRDTVVRYPWSMGYVEVIDGAIVIGANYIEADQGGLLGHLKIWMPIIVPTGYKLRWVVFRLKRSNLASADGTVFMTFPDALVSTLGTTPPAIGVNWEERIVEGAPIEQEAVAGASFLGMVELRNSAPTANSFFMDMEVACTPVLP